jgi:hypothetical protein
MSNSPQAPDEPPPSDSNIPVPIPSPPSGGTEESAESATKDLTPEEQMDLFEKELKENDWGHQPC